MTKPYTIFDEIESKGHDEDFQPVETKIATGHAPGSWGKIATLAERVARGESLWHESDFRKHICTVEESEEGMREVQMAVSGERTSKEFQRRRSKFHPCTNTSAKS